LRAIFFVINHIEIQKKTEIEGTATKDGIKNKLKESKKGNNLRF